MPESGLLDVFRPVERARLPVEVGGAGKLQPRLSLGAPRDSD